MQYQTKEEIRDSYRDHVRKLIKQRKATREALEAVPGFPIDCINKILNYTIFSFKFPDQKSIKSKASDGTNEGKLDAVGCLQAKKRNIHDVYD